MAVAQGTLQRDQQALTVLNQTIAAGGGPELLASVQDYTEKGAITYNSTDQVTGDVTVKGRGLHQFKVEADLSTGKRTTVVNGESGSMKETNGWVRPIYRQGAADLGGLTLPYLPLIAAMQDSSTSIIYGGLVSHNGTPAYDIRLLKVYTKGQDPSGDRGVKEARDFYIDPKALLVVAISDRIHFGVGPHDEGVPHEIIYSNYQPESGITVPLTIVETVRGVTGVTMKLSQIALNSGLSDSDFSL
jgi:hypothetical protein